MLKIIFVYIKNIDNKRSGDTAKAKKNCRYHRCHLMKHKMLARKCKHMLTEKVPWAKTKDPIELHKNTPKISKFNFVIHNRTHFRLTLNNDALGYYTDNSWRKDSQCGLVGSVMDWYDTFIEDTHAGTYCASATYIMTYYPGRSIRTVQLDN